MARTPWRRTLSACFWAAPLLLWQLVFENVAFLPFTPVTLIVVAPPTLALRGFDALGFRLAAVDFRRVVVAIEEVVCVSMIG